MADRGAFITQSSRNGGEPHKETDYEHCTVGRSSATRSPLFVRRWHEVRYVHRGNDEAGSNAGLVSPLHRRGRSPWRARFDPPLAHTHSSRADAAGRRRAGDHHDRCDHGHLDDRSDRVRIDHAGDWAALCFHSIRPLAAYAAALTLGRSTVRTGEIVNTAKTAA